ncbi:hypothetical protein ACFVW1_10335 [Streptomyces olivochromogenes]|uniref:hypothetical protein n=1 Tax=Streptomyces olivochromogenes TaxID=1963 RepID=UPI0036D9A613
MKSRLRFAALPAGVESLELKRVLSFLVEWRAADPDGSAPPELPSWLVDSFSEPLSAEDKMLWLARWRAAGPEEKEALERQKGWELESWIHWFSTDNDMWAVESVEESDQGGVDITLSHDDDPFPFEALHWMADVAGFTLEGPVRSVV